MRISRPGKKNHKKSFMTTVYTMYNPAPHGTEENESGSPKLSLKVSGTFTRSFNSLFQISSTKLICELNLHGFTAQLNTTWWRDTRAK